MNHSIHPPSNSTPSLYLPEFEHSSCGVGFIASLKGVPSRQITDLGLQALASLAHRGAVDADGKTGDGAGILTNLPRTLFAELAAELGHPHVDAAAIGVGVFFLPTAAGDRRAARELVERATRDAGVTVLGCAPCRSMGTYLVIRRGQPCRVLNSCLSCDRGKRANKNSNVRSTWLAAASRSPPRSRTSRFMFPPFRAGQLLTRDSCWRKY